MTPRRFALALALAVTPGLALAQAAPSDPGQSAMPPNFGDPDERAAPTGPDAGAEGDTRPGDAERMNRGGMHGGMTGGMMGGMMDHAEMMRRHHGGGHGGDGPGSASISIRSGDRALMIRCGDTPIPDCVTGAQPLIELMR